MRFCGSQTPASSFQTFLGRSPYGPKRGGVTLVCLAIGGLAHLSCAATGVASPAEQKPGGPPGVVVEALSKGKGVPESTRKAMAKVRALLQDLKSGDKLSELKETRIGLEGETRVCAEFKDARAARETTERLRAIAADVELLNVREGSSLACSGAALGRRASENTTPTQGGQ